MSLDWSTEKCLAPIPRSRKEAVERDRLIFASEAVGLSTVSRENEREWLVRLHVWHQLGRGRPLGQNPLGVLERWIGLETNVEDRTRDEWRNRALVAAFDRAEFQADQALR